MTTSDWTAIAAIGASVIFFVGNLIFNYYTNKQNIKAKRADIATEKSIDAFREVVEAFQVFKACIYYDDYKGAIEADQSIINILRKYCFYFPGPFYYNEFIRIYSEFERYISDKGMPKLIEKYKDNFEITNTEFNDIVTSLQKHVGLKVVEDPYKNPFSVMNSDPKL
jgi:hypothetical protein